MNFNRTNLYFLKIEFDPSSLFLRKLTYCKKYTDLHLKFIKWPMDSKFIFKNRGFRNKIIKR